MVQLGFRTVWSGFLLFDFWIIYLHLAIVGQNGLLQTVRQVWSKAVRIVWVNDVASY